MFVTICCIFHILITALELTKCDCGTCMNVETIWTSGGRMGGMQVLRRGGGEIVPSLITTQMVQGPFLLTDVRAHVGKHKTVIFTGDDTSLRWGVVFSLTERVTSQKHQLIPSAFVLLFSKFWNNFGMSLFS